MLLGYTSSINDILRKGKTNVLTKELDEAFNIYGESELNEFYRTVDWDYMKNIYGLTKENINDFLGKTFKNKGYMSTSKQFKSPWSEKWYDYELVLYITGDITYLDINKIFKPEEIDCEDQEELLLPRNTILKLDKYLILENKEKTYQINMTII